MDESRFTRFHRWVHDRFYTNANVYANMFTKDVKEQLSLEITGISISFMIVGFMIDVDDPLSIHTGTIADEYEYTPISATEYQFGRRGDLPTNYTYERVNDDG